MSASVPEEPLVYTEEAKERINAQGFDSVRLLISSVPRPQLIRIASRLPRINGFRADRVADEQLKRLARRLTTRDAADSTDWETMTQLWVLYCGSSVATELGTVLINADRAQDELTRDFDLLEEVRGQLEQAAKAGTITREILDLAIQLSPFAKIGGLLAATRDAPTRVTIEQGHQLDNANRRLKEIEARLAKLETRGDLPGREVLIRAEDLQTQVVALRAALTRQEELTEAVQRIASEERFTAIATDLKSLSQRLDSDSVSLRQSTDELRSELTAQYSALTRLFDEHLNRSEKQSAAVDITDGRTPTLAGTGGPSIVIQHDDVPTRSTPSATSLSELRSAIAESIYALGLNRQSSAEAAIEVTAAIAAGQMVSFRGSAAGLMAATVQACFPGEWDNALIPIGLGDQVTLTGWHRTTTSRNLLLFGVNHSAFEIYGQALRQEIVRAQLTSTISEHLYLSVVTEGPAALPLIQSFVDLGPIVDTDSLDWRMSASAVAPPNVHGQFLELRNGFNLVQSLGDAKSALDEAREPFVDLLTALGTQTINRALGTLMEIEANDEAAYWRSLYYSWLHPQLRAFRVSRDRAQRELLKSHFAGVLGTPRGRRLLTQLGGQ